MKITMAILIAVFLMNSPTLMCTFLKVLNKDDLHLLHTDLILLFSYEFDQDRDNDYKSFIQSIASSPLTASEMSRVLLKNREKSKKLQVAESQEKKMKVKRSLNSTKLNNSITGGNNLSSYNTTIELKKALHNVPLSKKSVYDNMMLHSADYYVDERLIKFYISKNSPCSVFINETINYIHSSNLNYVEHMVLHNNADRVDPHGIYSSEVDVNFCIFNKKQNMFTTFFEDKGNKSNSTFDPHEVKIVNKESLNYDIAMYAEKSFNEIEGPAIHKNKTVEFSIEYDYEAIGLIKSHDISLEQGLKSTDTHRSINGFIWKILNENTENKLSLRVEIYFDVSHEELSTNLLFNIPFMKSVDSKNITKLEWEGELNPQEVLILNVEFPLIFSACEFISFNIAISAAGSLIIIFVISMLYVILSSLIFNDF